MTYIFCQFFDIHRRPPFTYSHPISPPRHPPLDNYNVDTGKYHLQGAIQLPLDIVRHCRRRL